MEGARPKTDLVGDTSGGLQPRYEVAHRQVGHLVCGDLMIEPVFGEVRVAAVLEAGYDEIRHVATRQVYWIEDDGCSTAARCYPADAVVAVRQPALLDRALIR